MVIDNLPNIHFVLYLNPHHIEYRECYTLTIFMLEFFDSCFVTQTGF